MRFNINSFCYSRHLLAVVFFGVLACSICAPRYASAAPVVTLQEGGVSLTLTAGARNQYQLAISPVGSQVTVAPPFALSAPNRLVVDLVGSSLKKSRQLYSSPDMDTFVLGVRLGAHADGKARIVIDLSGPATFTQGGAGATTQISFAPAGSPVSTAPQPPRPLGGSVTLAGVPTVAAISVVPPTITPVASIPAVRKQPAVATATVVVPKLVPSAVPTPIPTATPAPVAKVEPKLEGLAVRSITFQDGGLEEERSIAISVTTLGEYRVARVDERTFEVLLSGFRLGSEALALPQFPPSDFEGVTFVRPMERTGGVRILIGTERGYRITPMSRGGQIILRVSFAR